MNEVQRVARQGFILEKNDLDLAFLSLRIALKSYFGTYDIIRNRFSKKETEIDKDLEGNLRYCESCAETIVHFQHFFELIVKDILRKDHLLLASRSYSNPIIFHKILHKKPLNSEEEQNLKSVEFGDALKTICTLIQKEQIKNFDKIKFIKENQSVLEELNTLRNRVWHRGAFFLFYTKLDEFIGKFILPVVENTTNLYRYKKVGFLWKWKHTTCGVDPIRCICEEYKKNKNPDIGKIALIKEIGRAAYSNPLHDKKIIAERKYKRSSKLNKQIREFEMRGEEIPKRLLISKGMASLHQRMAAHLDEPYIKKAVKLSKHEAEENFFAINNCPVCGVKSLVLYDETDSFEDSKTGKYIDFNFIHTAKCECCSFEVESKLEIEKYNLPIDNYWKVRQI